MLSCRIHSASFVLAYGYNTLGYGVFFGLSGLFANAVVRNRIKRVFRGLVEKELSKDCRKNLCLCLISKKGVKAGCDKDAVLKLVEEVKEIVKRLGEKL